jgi:hypothetical protein
VRNPRPIRCGDGGGHRYGDVQPRPFRETDPHCPNSAEISRPVSVGRRGAIRGVVVMVGVAGRGPASARGIVGRAVRRGSSRARCLGRSGRRRSWRHPCWQSCLKGSEGSGISFHARACHMYAMPQTLQNPFSRPFIRPLRPRIGRYPARRCRRRCDACRTRD